MKRTAIIIKEQFGLLYLYLIAVSLLGCNTTKTFTPRVIQQPPALPIVNSTKFSVTSFAGVIAPNKTNTVSVIYFVVPNGHNNTNIYYEFFQDSYDMLSWKTIVTNIEYSGYYITNNIFSTNYTIYFRTVSE